MDGNSRFELMSASSDTNFAGNYQSGQRGYTSPSLSRSSSFREGSENRNVSSGKVNGRGSAISSGDVTSLSQCLMLDPIVMSEQRYARSGEFRRVLASSVGRNSEENGFMSAHLKNSPPAAVEDLKRLRASVADTCVKASGRAKKLDEHLSKLYKYVETLPSKKPQQQRNDDRPKIVGLSKRSRTSTSEPQADSFQRQGRQLRRQMWMQNLRTKLMIAGAILALVFLLWLMFH